MVLQIDDFRFQIFEWLGGISGLSTCNLKSSVFNRI